MISRASLVAAAVIGLGLPPAYAQTVRPDLWCTDGAVSAGALSGNLLYIGGNFAFVGPATGAGVPLDAATGAVPSSFPKVFGAVNAVVPDGSGGWFIGGAFSKVDGVPRSGLAHLLADMTLSDWNPSPNQAVNALVLNGSTLYVGGSFTNIGGQTRNRIAAFDVVTGNATAWNPNADGNVLSLAVSGSTVYVGGAFNNVGNQMRSCLAALDANGAATAWNPSPSAPPFPSTFPYVTSIVSNGSTVFVAGDFGTIGFRSRHCLAALDATTGSASSTWNPNPNLLVRTMLLNGSKLYVGGDFSSIGGQSLNSIAALDVTSGAPDGILTGGATWTVEALALSGNTLYAGGYFTTFLGQARSRIAAADVTTGLATAWNPTAAGSSPHVLALAVSGSTLYAGGSFNIMGAVPRRGLAALDLTSGQATAWNPNPDGRVTAMIKNGSTIYASGGFANIGGQPRSGIGAVDATTGNANTWNPGVNDVAYALAISGSTLYVGGQFSGFGGQPRNGLGAVDLSSNIATTWDPHPSNPLVNALAVSGSTIYVGGFFSSIGGQTRHNIAALDAATGNAATLWDPDASSIVDAILIDGSTMYVGGGFSNFIGGQAHSYLAALDVATGDATSWNPTAPSAEVKGLTLGDGAIYFCGTFGSVGGQARSHFAAVDATTGALRSWNPGAQNVWSGIDTEANAVISGSSKVYVMGHFDAIGGQFNSNLAEVSAATVGVPEPPGERPGRLSLSSRPNPFHGGSLIRFFLPRPAEVTLTVYDVSGREVARIADRKPFSAGPQEIRFEGRGLQSGVYVCWLRAGGESASRRMVLIP